MYLAKLAHYCTWPHHRLTTLLYLYMHACKCQLFTDEKGSRRLPKRSNCYFWPDLYYSTLLHYSGFAYKTATAHMVEKCTLFHTHLWHCSLNRVPFPFAILLWYGILWFAPKYFLAITTCCNYTSCWVWFWTQKAPPWTWSVWLKFFMQTHANCLIRAIIKYIIICLYLHS